MVDEEQGALMGYEGKPLSDPVHPAAMLMAAKAREGKLVVCAGAGLSVAPDAGLPSGERLGELLNERMGARLEGYTAPANPKDLLAVADAAVEAIGGLLVLQHEVLTLADFDRATPNFGHRALALLLADGAVSAVLLWNWDTCVERSAPEGERVEVALTLADMQQLQMPNVAKVHGCATRVETLLITSEQLRTPPLWTDAAFTAKLRGATGVFVGVGDVADYAKKRITELAAELPGLGVEVFVVSPGIVEKWEGSIWAELLPGLEAARRVAKSADELFDELARLWALDLVETLEDLTANLTGIHAAGAEGVADGLRALCGADVIASMRASAFQHRFGDSVLRSAASREALVALAVLAGEAGVQPKPFTDGHWQVDDHNYDIVIVTDAAPAGGVRQEAFRRTERLAGRGRITGEATFIVAGVVVGPLNHPPAPDLGDGEVELDDIFMGPRGIGVRFISAAEIVARAA